VIVGLDADELRALRQRARLDFDPPWAFPAPDGCRSLEEWARDGERRWALLWRKVGQARPTAHGSSMLTRA
jgi:hypothetical protein